MAGNNDSTLQGALKRILDNQPQMQVTKLPAEEPKFNGKGASIGPREWPTDIYIDDKKYPWLSKVEAGQEVILIVKAKIDDITTHESEKDEPKKTAIMRILEIGKFGGAQ